MPKTRKRSQRAREAKGAPRPVDLQKQVEGIVEHGNALLTESARVAVLLQSLGRIVARPGGDQLIYRLSQLADDHPKRFDVLIGGGWSEWIEFENERAEDRGGA